MKVEAEKSCIPEVCKNSWIVKWTIENEGWFGKSMTVRRHTWHVITEYVTEIDMCHVCVWRERGRERG